MPNRERVAGRTDAATISNAVGPACYLPDAGSEPNVLVCLEPSLLYSGLTQVFGALNVPFTSTPTLRRDLLTNGSLLICDEVGFAAAQPIERFHAVVFSETPGPSSDRVRWLPPSAPTSVLVDLASRWRSCATSAALSTREREILTLVSQGLSNEEVASQCFVSPATVKTHLMRTFRKLGVSDRASAVYKAAKMGLI